MKTIKYTNFSNIQLNWMEYSGYTTESEFNVGLTVERKFGDESDDTFDGPFSIKKEIEKNTNDNSIYKVKTIRFKIILMSAVTFGTAL